jgi:Lon protease-like protein
MRHPTAAWMLACAAALAGLSLTIVARSQQPPAPSTPFERLPDTIPIFPLPDPTLFPLVARPLHIFEPRYREMVADALRGDRIIGMVTLQPGYEADYEGRPAIFQIGCAGLITDVEELPGGEYNIMVQGLMKFRVVSEDHSRPYRLARVYPMPEFLEPEQATALGTQRLRLEELFAAPSKFGAASPEQQLPKGLRDEELVNTLSQFLKMDASDRQRLLEREGVLSRSTALIELLEKQR